MRKKILISSEVEQIIMKKTIAYYNDRKTKQSKILTIAIQLGYKGKAFMVEQTNKGPAFFTDMYEAIVFYNSL